MLLNEILKNNIKNLDYNDIKELYNDLNDKNIIRQCKQILIDELTEVRNIKNIKVTPIIREITNYKIKDNQRLYDEIKRLFIDNIIKPEQLEEVLNIGAIIKHNNNISDLIIKDNKETWYNKITFDYDQDKEDLKTQERYKKIINK